MAVPELGWSTLAEAKSYFTNQRISTTAWDVLAADDDKNKVLNNAYNRLYHNPDYFIPAVPTAAQLVKLKLAQQEFAYYLAQHLADEDRRKGIQAQGVERAGIVEEVYEKDMLSELPIPPFVDALMEDFKTAIGFGMVDIDRDEEESVDTDATDV